MSRHTLIVLTVLLAAGCSDPVATEDPNAERIAQLTRAVEDLAASNQALAKDVRRNSRHLSGMSRDAAARGSAPHAMEAVDGHEVNPHEAASAAIAADPETAADPTTTDGSVMDALLATEAGRKAIHQAATKAVARREDQERRLYVSYAVGVFAREAGLDTHESSELQRIWKESMDKGAALRKQLGAISSLPEAERTAARGEAMTAMHRIGAERQEEIDALLNAEQRELYEKVDEEIVGSLHGGSRKGPGRPAASQPGTE